MAIAVAGATETPSVSMASQACQNAPQFLAGENALARGLAEAVVAVDAVQRVAHVHVERALGEAIGRAKCRGAAVGGDAQALSLQLSHQGAHVGGPHFVHPHRAERRADMGQEALARDLEA